MTNSNEKHSSQGLAPLDWSLQESKIEVLSFVHCSGMSERLGESGVNIRKGMVGSGQALDLLEKLGWPNNSSTSEPSGFSGANPAEWGEGVPGKTS